MMSSLQTCLADERRPEASIRRQAQLRHISALVLRRHAVHTTCRRRQTQTSELLEISQNVPLSHNYADSTLTRRPCDIHTTSSISVGYADTPSTRRQT